MEKYGALLEPGVGLLLRQCTIFSFISVQKYVNITLPNVVHIYNTSSLHPDQGIIDKHIVEVMCISLLTLLESYNYWMSYYIYSHTVVCVVFDTYYHC